jgi:glycosyltransferase involved in cell wall biosynthesis
MTQASAPPIAVGIVDQTSAGWLAGSSYTRSVLLSLAGVAAEHNLELTLVSSGSGQSVPAGVRHLSLELPRLLPGERALRRGLGLSSIKQQALRGEARLRDRLNLLDASSPFFVARRHRLDVLLPLLDVPPWPQRFATVGWIPDFQHRVLPEYFSPEDRARRDASCARLARYADGIVVSSQAAQADLVRELPQAAATAVVAPFPSMLVFDPIATANTARARYGLPERFALVANQFWRHKNHRLVIEALALLRARGFEIPVVMTGLPADYRDPSNALLSELHQAIAEHGLHPSVRILGQVPRSELFDLMRTAAVIIQPSLFEGWSTLVEDALTLGRPLMCSDLAVHREQAPDCLGLFDPRSADALAALLARAWPGLAPGPDAEGERVGRCREQAVALRFGNTLAALCRRVARPHV